jgi:hypothetical protein
MEHRLKGEIPVQIAHRKFLAGIGAEAAATAAAPLPGRALMTATPPRVPMDSFTSSQKTGQPHIMNWVAVINDEISQDFGRACEVASRIRDAVPHGESRQKVCHRSPWPDPRRRQFVRVRRERFPELYRQNNHAFHSCLHPSHQRISCGTVPPGRPLND